MLDVIMQDAAAILGISLNTLRRRIDAGQVKAEQVQRPQGYVWRVYLDSVQQHPPEAPAQHADSTLHQDAASTLPQPPTGLAQAEAMAAYTRSVLEPLVQALEHANGQIAWQAEAIGTLKAERDAARAELDALKASQAQQEARETASTPEVATGRWRRVVATLTGGRRTYAGCATADHACRSAARRGSRLHRLSELATVLIPCCYGERRAPATARPAVPRDPWPGSWIGASTGRHPSSPELRP
jgi:hypothetical protein